uniref:JmjC domain-containing protein n=1 Tax=Lactuca sativa TaxID=4236 RepID=A0A9R1UUR2_LACSA|nr:hypothetical protein LSAT_V11C800436170 [Lactuca sativa]
MHDAMQPKWTMPGIEAWSFVQKLGDVVLIPAGCAYQVRNLKGSSGLDVVGTNCHVTNLPKATCMVSFLLLSLSLSCFGLCFYIVLKVESIIHLFQEIKESVQSDSRHLSQEYHKIIECI